jgi:hypothetical protein
VILGSYVELKKLKVVCVCEISFFREENIRRGGNTVHVVFLNIVQKPAVESGGIGTSNTTPPSLGEGEGGKREGRGVTVH